MSMLKQWDGTQWISVDAGVPGPPGPPGPNYPPSIVPQHWNEIPIDQSAAVQALIDQAVNPASPWGTKVQLPPGVIYCAVQMRAYVELCGAGKATSLVAMPGQTAPVLDYTTYNAFNTLVHSLTIDGNYVPGRLDGLAQGACRLINMDNKPGNHANIQSFPFNTTGTNGVAQADIIENGMQVYQGVDYYWRNQNDANNVVRDVDLFNCGGDWAMYIGIDQRNTVLDNLYMLGGLGGSIRNLATDTWASNISAGEFSYGIFVGGTNQQWVQCKSWYTGKNAGYNTANVAGDNSKQNNGWNIWLPSTTTGNVRLSSCEGQDSAGYDLHVWQAVGSTIKQFMSGGSGGGVYLGGGGGTVQYNSIEANFTAADLTGDTTLFTIDGAAVIRNKIEYIADLAVLASSTLYNLVNSAQTLNNDVRTYDPVGNEVQANVSGNITPHSFKSYFSLTAAATVQMTDLPNVDSYPYGDRLSLGIYATGNDQTVSWATNYHAQDGAAMAPENIPASSWRVWNFVWLGTGWFMERPHLPEVPALPGIKNTAETRFSLAAAAAADTVVYTAPADVSFAWCPALYAFNSSAASATLTVKCGGVIVYSAAIGAGAGLSKGGMPPLRPGDTITVNGGTAGAINVYGAVYECRDPSWKLSLTTMAAATITPVYTCPAGKKARSAPYLQNLTQAVTLVPANGTANVNAFFTPSGGARMQFYYQSFTGANSSSVAFSPLTAEMIAGDVLSFSCNLATTVWTLVQEY